MDVVSSYTLIRKGVALSYAQTALFISEIKRAQPHHS